MKIGQKIALKIHGHVEVEALTYLDPQMLCTFCTSRAPVFAVIRSTSVFRNDVVRICESCAELLANGLGTMIAQHDSASSRERISSICG